MEFKETPILLLNAALSTYFLFIKFLFFEVDEHCIFSGKFKIPQLQL